MGQSLNYAINWLGNTGGTPLTHIQQRIDDIAVDTDGTVYTNSEWDEGGSAMGVYQNGQRTGNMMQAISSGWGRSPGGGVAFDSNYVYLAIAQNGDDGANTNRNANNLPDFPSHGTQWYCIMRMNKNGSAAPFSTGYGWLGNFLIVQSNTMNSDGSYTWESINGLAVANGTLYAADTYNNRILEYSTSNLSLTGQFSLASPTNLATDASGHLWANTTNKGVASVVELNSSGTVLATVTFAAGVIPTDIAIDNSGRLLVADHGPDLNIKIYNPSSLSGSPTSVASTFGDLGGITSGTPGQCQPMKFHGPRGVGVDASGNIYVASAATTGIEDCVIQSLTPGGAANWTLYGLDWVDCASMDAASETDIYTQDSHYTMNYASAPGGTGWAYKGYTINADKYPNDPRLHAWTSKAWMRRIGGERILYVTAQENPLYVEIYRFNPSTDGETAIPCGMIVSSNFSSTDGTTWSPPNQPAGEWIWRDGSNGGALDGNFDGREYVNNGGQNSPFYGTDLDYTYVDSNGGVWMTSASQWGRTEVRYYPCNGLDSNGCPIYQYTNVETFSAPGLTTVSRVEYRPEFDELYLAGYSTTYPQQASSAGFGSVILRFPNWSAGNQTPATALPIQNTNGNCPNAFAVCGNYLFLGMYAPRPSSTLVYNRLTGAFIGTLGTNATIGNAIGDLDDANGVDAYQRANGEYIVFQEDDGFEKTVMYRWSGYTDADVGSPGSAGSASYFSPESSNWTVAGGGADIWNTSDQFHFASQPAAGNTTIVAEVTSITNTDGWAKAGVMFRDTSAAGSMFVDMVATEGNGVSLQWRNATNGGCGYTQITGVAAPSTSNPVWVKLVNSGGNFTGYYSLNGTSWTLAGSTSVSFVNNTYLAGIAVTSHNNGLLNTSTFSNVCVSPALTDADIGSPGNTGSASYNRGAGIWTVAGGGSDIWNNSDQFNFESESVTGGGALVAKVTSITNTNGWAKAGVMFRDTNSPGSMFVDMVATQSSGVSFQWRNATGGACGYTEIAGIGAPSASNPVWVKLLKTGTSYAGYYSLDGINWTLTGSASVSFANNVTCLGGLAVTAHNNSALNAATFANVSF